MDELIQIPFEPQPFSACLASGAPGGRGVLVLPAWWGLNPFMRGLCARLAEEGFTALAPDLYHGAVAQTINEAKVLRNRLDRDLAQAKILAAAAHLQALTGGQPLALIGFSLGAYLGLSALELMAARVGAVVLFYGGRRVKFKRTRAKFLVHLAETDPYLSADEAQALKDNLQAAHLPVEFFTYSGTGHWFFESDRPEAFAPAAGQLAWERTVEFLRK